MPVAEFVNPVETVTVPKFVERRRRPLLLNWPPLIVGISARISKIRATALLITAVLSRVRLPKVQAVLELTCNVRPDRLWVLTPIVRPPLTLNASALAPLVSVTVPPFHVIGPLTVITSPP